jgi:hypothetical protein
MQRAWSKQHIYPEKTALVQLVQARRAFGVSDLRDMVFAHIEFAANGDVFVVGYSKTFAQVFADFAAQMAERHGFVMLLDLV